MVIRGARLGQSALLDALMMVCVLIMLLLEIANFYDCIFVFDNFRVVFLLLLLMIMSCLFLKFLIGPGISMETLRETWVQYLGTLRETSVH